MSRKLTPEEEKESLDRVGNRLRDQLRPDQRLDFDRGRQKVQDNPTPPVGSGCGDLIVKIIIVGLIVLIIMILIGILGCGTGGVGC